MFNVEILTMSYDFAIHVGLGIADTSWLVVRQTEVLMDIINSGRTPVI